MKQATLLFLVQDDQILLAMKKRGFGVGYFNGIGGKIEYDEEIEEAAVRECKEEISITPISPRRVGHLTFHNQEIENQDTTVHVLVTESWEGEPVETEEMKPEWFFMDMIPYDKMWEGDIHWLPLIIEGNAIRGEFTFDQDDHIVSQNLEVVEADSLYEA